MRFLFVDRIIESSPNQWVRGIKNVTLDDDFLTQDKEGRLCFMPSLIGETLGQLAAWNVMASCHFTHRPVAGVVSSARLYRPAYLGETVLLESFIDAVDDKAVEYHSIARVGQERLFVIEGALGPLLPMADFIGQQTVKQQYEEIFRPGDWAVLSQQSMPVDTLTSLPSRPLLIMAFDRILDSVPGEYLVAEKRITRSAPYFPDHFPHKPVLPMTVLLECIQNTVSQFVEKSYTTNYEISELRRIKMNEFVQPGDVLTCTMKVKAQTENELILTCRSEVEGKRVCVVEVVLKAKGFV